MNELEAPEGIEGPDQENLENVSPSFRSGNKKPRTSAPKEKAKDEGIKESSPQKKPLLDRGKDIVKNIGHKIASSAAKLAAKITLPYAAPIIAVLLIIILIFGSLGAEAITGYFGGVLPQPAGKDNVHVKNLIAAEKQKAQGNTYKFELPNKADQDYLASGQIDARLAAALDYLVQHHQHIRVSHIVSGYQDLSVNPESGAFHDTQITKNISDHQRGEAADIDEIDYVKQQCKCGNEIPVKVSWQVIGENPYGQAPDVLQNIKSATDLTQDQIKQALQAMGVGGLDQTDINSKLKTVNGINSVFDLTNPSVIASLQSIGITGIDNTNLQSGLKRLQALQQLYNLSPTDISTLTSGQGADLLSQIGVQMTPEMQASIKKYQQAQVLEQINSVDDLSRPDVQAALQAVGIDPNDPNFKNYLGKMFAVNTITNWQGSPNDPNLQSALGALNLPTDQNTQNALALYQAYKNGLNISPGQIVSDPNIYAALQQSGINIDNPTAQTIFSVFRAANQAGDPNESAGSVVKNTALAYLGLNATASNQDLFNKYQAAEYLANFHGDLNDPQFQASLQILGVGADQLNTIQQLGTIQTLTKYTNLKDLYPADFQKLNDVQSILNIKNASDLQSPAVQQALNDFNINVPANYKDMVGYASMADLVKSGNSAKLLATPQGQQIITNLNIPPSVVQGLGYATDISALTSIHNPTDLARPDVQAALSDFGVNTGQAGNVLGQVGDINALLSIKNPQDLLNPSTIKALGDLGVINVDSQLLGQIGAVQSLLNIRSVSDIFNPNTVLALNQLGIIGLSNPATAALTAVLMLDQVFGLNLFSCQGNTNCYKSAAQANVHKVIGELLQFPYDEGNSTYYRVTQLITYSEALDVTPFSSQTDQLYGAGHPQNFGLFAMPESSDHIHIGY